MTTPVWAERFCVRVETMPIPIIIFLCPYVIYFLYKGLLDNEKGKVIFGGILLVLMISVYQMIVPLFICGVFVCFILLQENSDYDARVYLLLSVKLFAALIAALAAYFLLNKIILSLLHLEKSERFSSELIYWGLTDSIKENIFRILSHGYVITIGNIPAVRAFFEPFILKSSASAAEGVDAVLEIASIRSRLVGNVFLLPIVIYFIIQTARFAKRRIPAARRLLFILAGIGIPVSIMLLAIVQGKAQTIRTMWALPLATGIMLFFLLSKVKKPIASIITCLALLISVYQAETSAQLFYSGYVQYQDDVFFAHELNRMIHEKDVAQELPVAIIGQRQDLALHETNFLQGEAIGHSLFGSPQGGLTFMKTLGMSYNSPDELQMEEARKVAVSMPSYPAPGCIKRLSDVIVVKLSDSTY
jgi:hypothetical protein